ncbi:MAG: isochorismatase family protein [Verrucomicrobiales bacterium]|nr:isochorismatase family protein [Verrucomicrobiales bacterium]
MSSPTSLPTPVASATPIIRESTPRQRPQALPLLLLAFCAAAGPSILAGDPKPLLLHARHRVAPPPGQQRDVAVEEVLRWEPKQTAVIICDMWDRHWCRGATERVAEMAPRMNALIQAARARGVLIIHAPSDTMSFYEGWPQRLSAQQAPKVTAPAGINQWKSLDRDKEPPLPIDDSDGGCNEDPPCPQGRAWKSQIATLEIADADLISDSGEEIHRVLESRGIRNVIVLGVHTNMCVLGRPFSIRALVGQGKNVVLMRDLTDTMYNARRRPYVSHFAGTDLVVAHIERYWCPSVTSADLLGGEPFRFQADVRPRVLFLIGEDEYHTWETLPVFAHDDLAWRGFDVRVLLADAQDKHAFPGLAEALPAADLLVVSTRRRALTPPALKALRAHLGQGKPLVAIRTASHGFAVRGEERSALAQRGLVEWPEFDAEVLGGNYRGHYGVGPVTTLAIAEGAAGHPVLTGLDPTGWLGHASLYRSGPLRPGCHPLLLGSIPGQPAEPVAWTRAYGPRAARVFYTSFGHVEDFAEPAFRRLLLNGILWALGQPIPPAG